MSGQVNPWYLHVPLRPLTGLADDDNAIRQYQSVDPNDSTAVRLIIRQIIRPYVMRVDDASVARLKLAMRYYLSKPDSQWDRVFDSSLLPFESPHAPRDFFVWVWEECFPGESYLLDGLMDYEVIADCNSVNSELRVKPG